MSETELTPRLPLSASNGPVLVHCDAQRTHELVKGKRSRSEIVARHLEIIKELTDGRDAWVPTFNYDFCRTGEFDNQTDPSQSGAITEAFRNSEKKWRTSCPVFSFSGVGAIPFELSTSATEVDPFDSDSAFGELVRRDGNIVWYGAPFASTTLIHHAERCADGPVYRYDKVFLGVVTNRNISQNIALRYHVRPMGRVLEYDWERIFQELVSLGIVQPLLKSASVYWASASALNGYLVSRVLEDPLWLLDKNSRIWVEIELSELGRPFILSDFEEDYNV